jgi:hypothetical protein
MRLPTIVVFALLLGNMELAAAQSSAQNADRSFSQAWPSLCKTLATNSVSALSGPELQLILESHPIDIDLVCACIDARMKADKYLPVLFAENNGETLRSMESKSWRLYIRGKAATFVAACTASELERSVNAIYPGSGG